jgi:hypothetical protein
MLARCGVCVLLYGVWMCVRDERGCVCFCMESHGHIPTGRVPVGRCYLYYMYMYVTTWNKYCTVIKIYEHC